MFCVCGIGGGIVVREGPGEQKRPIRTSQPCLPENQGVGVWMQWWTSFVGTVPAFSQDARKISCFVGQKQLCCSVARLFCCSAARLTLGPAHPHSPAHNALLCHAQWTRIYWLTHNPKNTIIRTIRLRRATFADIIIKTFRQILSACTHLPIDQLGIRQALRHYIPRLN